MHLFIFTYVKHVMQIDNKKKDIAYILFLKCYVDLNGIKLSFPLYSQRCFIMHKVF